MSRFAHLIMKVSYLLGIVSMVVVVVFAAVPSLASKLHLTTRGGLVFAITLFLCSIASHLVGRASQSIS